MKIPEEIYRNEFGQDYQGNESHTGDQIKDYIHAISPDTPHDELPERLKVVISWIARPEITHAQADVHMRFIKDRFGFKADQIKKYEQDLNRLRKNGNRPPEPETLSQPELIKKLESETDSIQINPAQDYLDGRMYFAVKVAGTPYLLSGERKLISFDQAQEDKIYLRNKAVDTSRFSPVGIVKFLKGEYSVSILNIYERLHSYIKRFIFFTDDRWVCYLTLWVIGTYLHSIFSYYPYVWLNAEKGSGKSLLMKVLSRIAFNGEILIHPTMAVVFRDVSHNSISMFIDEVEQLRRQDKEAHSAMIGLLNTGFEKGGIVKRAEKAKDGSFEIRSYSAYSPKMFAGINEIDDVLQDRTVRIRLLRKKDSETVDRYKESEEVLALQRQIRDDLYVYALVQGAKIADLYHRSEIAGIEHLTNRELDIWEPIFLLANLVDAEYNDAKVAETMESLSYDSMNEKQEDSERSNETIALLSVFKRMQDEGDVETVPSSTGMTAYNADTVFDYFKDSDEYGWLEKKHTLTRRLKKIGIKNDRQQTMGTRSPVYLVKETEFQDLCERYGIL